jgi:hypothetical protein
MSLRGCQEEVYCENLGGDSGSCSAFSGRWHNQIGTYGRQISETVTVATHRALVDSGEADLLENARTLCKSKSRTRPTPRM